MIPGGLPTKLGYPRHRNMESLETRTLPGIPLIKHVWPPLTRYERHLAMLVEHERKVGKHR